MGGGNRSAASPVPGGKGRFQVEALHFPSPTSLSEPTMERTWLCRKERAEASTSMISPWRETVSRSSVFSRRLRLAFGGAEGGEVVMADEDLRRLVHGLGVERAEHAQARIRSSANGRAGR